MYEPVQHQGRQRSDSLQRMLELEKKMMFQRTQSLTSNSYQSSPAGSIAPSPIIHPQPRRFELVPKDGKKAPPPPVRNYGPVPPPLFTSYSAPDGASNAVVHQQLVAAKGHSRTNSAPIGMTDRGTQKTVAFAFPPDFEEQRSVCVSPTWEAYGQRKQDKRDRKEERREERREESRGRERTVEKKPRGRRLSKPPPPNHNLIRSNTEPVSPPKDKRSSSVMGIPISRRDTADTSRNEPAEKPRRGRSGSITSAIRGSFEIRRGSYDQTSASGFLGGVKLEHKKQDFTQQVIEDQSKNTSKVHPALRKSFLGYGSFTPLQTDGSSSPVRDNEEPEKRRRAYPPISLQTSGVMGQGAPPAQVVPARRGSSGSANIYLWSARAKKRTSEPIDDECAVDDEEDGEAAQELERITLTDTPPKEAGLTRRGGLHIKNGPRASLTSKFSTEDEDENETLVDGDEDIEPLHIAKMSSKETTPEPAVEPLPVLEPQPVAKTPVIEQKEKPSYPPTTVKTRPRRESTASTVSSPPAPPRKSSKRNSIVFLARSQTAPVEPPKEEQPPRSSKENPSSPSKENLRVEKKTPIVTKLVTSSKMRNPTPPSIRYETTLAGVRPTPYPAESPTTSTAKFNFKDTAKSAFARGGSGSSSQASLSPISGGTSPVLPPSPLKNETYVTPQPAAQQQQQPEARPVATSYSRPIRPSPEYYLAPKKQPSSTWRPTTSSSDDSSYSDGLQSSGPGTPDTSPPQSDSGCYHPRTVSGKIQPIQYSPYSSVNSSPNISPGDRFQLSDSPHSPESDLDPIEAAARRVMEAFSHANLVSPMDSGKDTDSSGDSSLVLSSPEPEPQPQRLRHREKSKSRLRNSQLQTLKLSQSANGIKATRSTPNLDVRKSQQPPVPEMPKSNRANPQRGDRVGKMFVVCCECKRYHDIPVQLYKTMLNPGGVFGSGGFEDRVCMTVKCSWCDHQMSTKCCPGVSGILDIQERVH
ncbi:hypothetical protein B0T10DRAFT_131880 [Thelonectria olida]|uniref:Uncharacterized protein n=1 Tax=Thelonectria olida TaxID=1576542 RepID=A0A9P8VZA0_9HYPO|nr:hypothetical protein B0T10DRAFT_131880 [Thelonectria olida]